MKSFKERFKEQEAKSLEKSASHYAHEMEVASITMAHSINDRAKTDAQFRYASADKGYKETIAKLLALKK